MSIDETKKFKIELKLSDDILDKYEEYIKFYNGYYKSDGSYVQPYYKRLIETKNKIEPRYDGETCIDFNIRKDVFDGVKKSLLEKLLNDYNIIATDNCFLNDFFIPNLIEEINAKKTSLEDSYGYIDDVYKAIELYTFIKKTYPTLIEDELIDVLKVIDNEQDVLVLI